MGIRGVQLRCRIGQVHARSQKPFRLRKCVPYCGEGEGLHLPPVPEALNRLRHARSRFRTEREIYYGAHTGYTVLIGPAYCDTSESMVSSVTPSTVACATRIRSKGSR